ncbi:hypothetical protein L6E12_01470 [Actinokineospora sp. PR83]|uniref:hypothetical protein n=1 Tax=Actinokineospora sp. PR83 TaxID=2884908 RepID=UPI001F2CB110|nr:hypothetical protein [Actinokineospora sp. PR83]MCG8914465.1 hypothetical protein [Actinokineospora sp. PR83]
MSVSDLARRLPGIDELRDRSRAMAMVEAVLSPDRHLRHHAFHAGWGEGAQLASRDNGSGDGYSIVFSAAGAYICGFDHESPMSPYVTDDGEVWPGLLDGVPEVFQHHVVEPAFRDEDGTHAVTVCLWREAGDARWRHGTFDYPNGDTRADGASYLFGLLTDATSAAFTDFAADYYGREIDLDAVRHVFALRPLDEAVVAALNPQVVLADLQEDIRHIGYPR